jgi:hypothetical protein
MLRDGNQCIGRGTAVPADRLGKYSNKVYEVMEKAIKAWNRRVNDDMVSEN